MMRATLIVLAVIGALAVALLMVFATGAARLAVLDRQPETPAPAAPIAPGETPAVLPTESGEISGPAAPGAATPSPSRQPDAPRQAVAAVPGGADKRAGAPHPVLPPVVAPQPNPAVAREIVDAGAAANVIDDPDGEKVLGALDNKTHLTLKGRVKTLKVLGVNGESVLDASGLEAKEIIVVGEINGNSTLKLHTATGSIRFEAPVNGHSTIRADAPNGVVTFAGANANQDGKGGKAGKGGSEINGESDVALTCRRVDFLSPINGTATRVDVALTRGGVIHFSELAGGVHLSYRKTDQADPEPIIDAGTVVAAAKVVRLGGAAGAE